MISWPETWDAESQFFGCVKLPKMSGCLPENHTIDFSAQDFTEETRFFPLQGLGWESGIWR